MTIYKEEETPEFSLHIQTEKRPCEDTVKPSASRGEGSHQKPTLLALDQRLSASRTVRNTFLLFWLPVCYFAMAG